MLPAARGAGAGSAARAAAMKCLHAHYANHLAGGDDPVAGDGSPSGSSRSIPRSGPPGRGDRSGHELAAGCWSSSRTARRASFPRARARHGDHAARAGRRRDRTPRSGRRSRGPTPVLGTLRRAGAGPARAAGSASAATAAVRDADEPGRVRARSCAPRPARNSEVDRRASEEAALSFLGGTHGLDAPAVRSRVLDIGGGSTEFVGRAPSRPRGGDLSTQMGSVRLTERFVRHDPPAAGRSRGDATPFVARGARRGGARPCRSATRATFVAVAGTATTVQAIALGLERYDPDRIHRTWLAAAEADRVLERARAR